MSNNLPTNKKIQILQMLCEGVSMRGIARIVDCSQNTVNSLLVSIGSACDKYHYMNVTGLSCKNVQVDEIWAFVGAKAKTETKNPEFGDVWTWTAVCPDSKMVIAWYTGDRSLDSARLFMLNLYTRLDLRVQISSDGHISYIQAVEAAFGGNVDFGMLVKTYNGETLDMTKTSVIGNPKLENISTSHVERQNLSMRMGMRRFTRRTNAHSKKLENHKLALSLYFLYHNFVRINSTIRVTPAMEAGLTDHVWSWEEVLALNIRVI